MIWTYTKKLINNRCIPWTNSTAFLLNAGKVSKPTDFKSLHSTLVLLLYCDDAVVVRFNLSVVAFRNSTVDSVKPASIFGSFVAVLLTKKSTSIVPATPLIQKPTTQLN